MPDRLLRGALGAALFFMLAGCSEQVTGSLACPQLCADQSAALRDTVLTGAVILDSTFTGFPLLGAPNSLTLVGQGDTADVRLIARFDTNFKTVYRPTGATADSAVTRVDSAMLILVIDTTLAKPTGPVRIDAFDVDTTAADTVPRALLPLFRPDRQIGTRTFAVGDIKDTLRVPISSATVLSKITNTRRLRIGLKLVNLGATGATARLRLSNTLPRLRYRVSADTLVAPDTVALSSSTPTDLPTLAASLLVYPVVASGVLPAPANTILAVGGLGGARSYLQFNIPSIVLDSVQVLRATLQLTQRPSRSRGVTNDTLTLVTHPVLAGTGITDLFTASQFIGSAALYGIDTLRLSPRDSGLRSIELVNLVRVWRAVGATNAVRSVVLRSPLEGESAGELDFYSSEATPATLRPTLRLTYVPRRGFGLP